jgi:signal transduction histidine kinase
MFQLAFSRLYPVLPALLWSVVWAVIAWGFIAALNNVHRMIPKGLPVFLTILSVFFGIGLGGLSLPGATTPQGWEVFVNHFGLVLAMTFIGVQLSIASNRRAVLTYLTQARDRSALRRRAVESEFSALAREISQRLHGTVRSTFLSGMLRVQKRLDEGKPDEAVAEIDALLSHHEQFVSFQEKPRLDELLSQIVKNWEGLIDITMHLVDLGEVPSRVEEAVITVVENAINDAVRHGRAHAVSIQLERDNDMLMVSVRNDGEPMDGNAAIGLGSVLLDRLATGGWSRTILEKRGTEVVARFVIDPQFDINSPIARGLM